MRVKRFLIPIFSIFTLLFFSSLSQPASADSSPYKQLSAPPSEMAAMALPDIAEQGVHSHSAMIPVELVNGAWQGEIAIESGETIQLMTLSNGAAWNLTLQSADGQTVGLNEASEAAVPSSFGIAENSYDALIYTLDNMSAGTWSLSIDGDATRDSQAGFIVYVNPNATTRQYSHLTSYNMVVGQPVGLRTMAFETDSDGMPSAVAGRIDSAEVTVYHPDGRQTVEAMAANADGSYGVELRELAAGDHTAQVRISGINSNGEPFVRTSEHLFPMIAETAALGATASTAVVDMQRWQINLEVTEAQAETYLVSAELWGSQNGEAVPVAWIGGMSDVVGSTVPVSVDGRWIALADAEAPFSLRNVRLQDRNTSIPVATMDLVELETRELPASVNARSVEITDDMLMGERPERAAQRSGGKLMLVHGYCSGDVWKSNQFTNDVKFLDLNQNRTHDQFATRIRNFGNNYPSFNIVAHSQGGAASLHLYTYYWSGLDYANTARLVQSVGTPYQGTILAGNLALLGDIFGVGCGTNYDLTRDGASAWLSGIPSWARDDVWYATTTYTDKWWRPDWCNIASSAIISGKDDGTTGQSRGQLSGGNNMGNKSGWCHTEGMRDPAQTGDSSRNALMNSFGDSRSSSGSNTPKIIVDGLFDDWFDAGGIEYCATGTGTLSQCVTSNQFSHLYFKTEADNACIRMDTDSDARTDYELCYDVNAPVADEAITLAECGNDGVCLASDTIATYPAHGFNAATGTIELGVGLADVGLALGDVACFSTVSGDNTLPAQANQSICYNTATGEASTVVQVPTAVTTSGLQVDGSRLPLLTVLALLLVGLSSVAFVRQNR